MVHVWTSENPWILWPFPCSCFYGYRWLQLTLLGCRLTVHTLCGSHSAPWVSCWHQGFKYYGILIGTETGATRTSTGAPRPWCKSFTNGRWESGIKPGVPFLSLWIGLRHRCYGISEDSSARWRMYLHIEVAISIVPLYIGVSCFLLSLTAPPVIVLSEKVKPHTPSLCQLFMLPRNQDWLETACPQDRLGSWATPLWNSNENQISGYKLIAIILCL